MGAAGQRGQRGRRWQRRVVRRMQEAAGGDLGGADSRELVAQALGRWAARSDR